MKNRTVKFYLLILPLLLISIGQANAQSDYKLAEQDSLALVAFYWATDGPNWTSNQEGFGIDDLTSEWQERYDGQFNNWLEGPAKDWFGIKVEKRPIPNSADSTYRVTWLWPVIGRRTDGQNLLKGYMPREVGLLTALERLRINGNDGFRDELMPDEIYHPSLLEIDPEACWFDGDVSDALRNCTSMRKMNLRYNNFDYIPSWDFLDEAALRNLEGTQWLYNSRFSYAYLEPIIEYFYTISPTPKEFRIENRDMFEVGDEREIVAPIGSSIDMICNDAGEKEEFISYQWFKNGLSRFGKDDKNFAITNVKESDYGTYTVRINNDYVKEYDQNTNFGEVFTKPIHLVPAPVPPVINKAVTHYNGQGVDLYFSKPMSDTELSAYQNMIVSADGRSIAVTGATVTGRINKLVKIELAEPILADEIVQLNFSEGAILDQNGGQMEAIIDYSVENRTRPAPQILSVATTLDGTGITIEFDQFMDANSLLSGTFEIVGDNEYEISMINLAVGEIDANISKKVLLSLNESITDTTEVITLSYLGGAIHGLYGGTSEIVEDIPVLNQVSVDRTAVLITFEDGTETLENIYLQGSWRPTPLPMYDDGTNGDAVANDHTWSYTPSLVKDEYSWDILLRTEIQVNDTIRTEDPNTGVVTLTIIPTIVALDSIISENILLNFSIADGGLSGETNFGIENLEVIFNVHTNGSEEAVYLMGINDDWAEGSLMQVVEAGQFYSDTLFRQTAGNIIEYNYRIGTDWENIDPEPRQYVVKNGVNIIEDFFGVFTSVDQLDPQALNIYPNPSKDGFITIEHNDKFNSIEIFNLSGQLIQRISKPTKNAFMLDLSNQGKELYLVKAISNSGKIYSSKIILQ